MGMKTAIGWKLRRMRVRMRKRARSGSAAIEFAFVAPVLFLFLFGIMETGILFFASDSLQNATDTVARMIRTGQLSGAVTAETMREQICSNITGLIAWADCLTGLQVDLRVYDDFATATYPSVTNADGTVDTTKITVDSTADCKVVLMRVYYTWTIMTPMMQPLLENTPGGKYLMSAAAAFRTEPYQASSTC